LTAPDGEPVFAVPKIVGNVEDTALAAPLPSKCLYPKAAIDPPTDPSGILLIAFNNDVPAL
jgi:hypothetical protein